MVDYFKRSSFLHLLGLFTCAATFCLIVAGASVTSTGSGLAVPDWPLSFGQFFPPMQGGVFFEHGHRMIAGTVGVLTFMLMVWLWLKEERKWLCWLGSAAFAMILLQALLGGITVLYRLPPKVSVAHAVLAQTFFCTLVALALFTSPYWAERSQEQGARGERTASLHRYPLLATYLIFFQLIVGAFSRHGMGEKFLFLHILLGLAIPFLVVSIFVAFKQNCSGTLFSTLPLSLILLTAIQLILGIFSALPKFGLGPFLLASLYPWLITLHVGIGALILGNSLLVTLLSFRFSFPKREGSFLKGFGETKDRIRFGSPLSEPALGERPSKKAFRQTNV